ncbi:MAG: nitrate/nitrite transporter NrtS [Oleispira antarctica]|uniref:Phosphoenolpyruvate-protein kinase n=1 Tax=Oleispira antarctica RB-8 TaxID=698738 RepID=R4YPX1_OLEAN|nr:nitrate/nitrite transporter NrtS [Oleispira antarctica]MBQ0791615.1 nitrate/nitrite transporter NrtS [Oleispira antarctica]CCK77132.1 Phosphoenolpyruvate-protein kinase, fragment [Oleispira antarctica RB-8]
MLAITSEREVIKRSLKTSLIVRSILAIINHGDALLALNTLLDRVIKMALTYVCLI